MSHIELVKNNGVPYLRIAEARYIKELGKQKKIIVKNLGPLSRYDDGEPDFLKRLREKFKNGEIDFDGYSYSNKNPKKYQFEFDFDKDNPQFGSIEFKNLGYLFIEKIYNLLGINEVLNLEKSRSKITYDLNGLTKLMVCNRILDPASKKATFENKDKYYEEVTTSNELKQIYRTLDVLDERSEAIQQRMNLKIKQSSIGRVTELTYYDVTNYYFEVMYGDEDVYELDKNGNIKKDENGEPIILKKGTRKSGVSKENRKEPIVQMGLFIDNNGLPVSYNIYSGNTQDKTTFTDMIRNSINKADLGRIIVVADNGMNTQENLYLLKVKGNGYIMSKSVKKSWKSHRDWILDENNYVVQRNKQGEITFKCKSRIIERTLKDKDGNKMKVKEKEIVFWSKKHYERQVHQNRKFIEYLESCKNHPDKLKDKQKKSQEFIKTIQIDPETGEILKTKEIVVLLNDKIQKVQELMGYYMIVTSEIDSDDKDIINRYHGLSGIEDSFRIIKSDLEGRPVFVSTKEHINAHFLICFIALTIIRIIQYKILKLDNKSTLNVDGWEEGITAEKIKENLVNYQCSIDKNGTCLITGITDGILKIYEALEVEYRLNDPTVTELNKLIREIKKAKL